MSRSDSARPESAPRARSLQRELSSWLDDVESFTGYRTRSERMEHSGRFARIGLLSQQFVSKSREVGIRQATSLAVGHVRARMPGRK